MHSFHDPLIQDALLRDSRRRFLTNSLWGAGAFALTDLLDANGLDAAPKSDSSAKGPLESRKPHFAARAKRCIYIYLEGGPSQVDLFDPKPKLNELDGQALPDSFLENIKFAFLDKATARLMGTSRTFSKFGESGMEFSNLLPNIATHADDICMIRSMHCDQFNHVPAQWLMNCGSPLAGRPSMGSWLAYGLGTESRNLPAYVTLLTKQSGIPGGAGSWSGGFLPSTYSGVLFGQGRETVLNLDNPAGITPPMQQSTVSTVNALNRHRLQTFGDPELNSRIHSYELAFRMQAAAPELVDLSNETQATLDMYGLDRKEPPIKVNRGGIGVFGAFSRSCLMARRLVERGVRVVNIIHSSWDHHNNLNAELPHNALMVDQPIAALLTDLKQRGLLEDTLVVWGSEFGRTPLGETRKEYATVTGRDHHPAAFSVWMAGGGVRGGQVIGASDEIGWHVAEDGVHIHDLHATILRLFGLDHTRLTYRFQGRDFRLTDVHGRVVDKVLL